MANGIQDTRGLKAILNDTPKVSVNGDKRKSQFVYAGEAVGKVIAIIEETDPKFHSAIFAAVETLRRANQGEDYNKVNDELYAAEARSKEAKAGGKKKRGWWR